MDNNETSENKNYVTPKLIELEKIQPKNGDTTSNPENTSGTIS
ncbi:MAG: hypothetical protein P1U39_06015 [Legionellaceae bacterium]|nr:hypothetical protein [Legionellaceae bacterium]